SVEVNDASFNRVNDAEVIATITSPAGKSVDLPLTWLTGKDGLYNGRWRPVERGTYAVEVRANSQGKENGRTVQFFRVGESNLEFYAACQNKALLTRIASQTNGKYYTLADLKSLPEEMTYLEQPNSIPQALPLWDMPALLFLVCLTLIAEWTL